MARTRACREIFRTECRSDGGAAIRAHDNFDIARFEQGAPRRTHARRLCRQCQPRIADAACVLARIYRDASGAGARGRGSEGEVPFDHARTGAKDGAARRRSVIAVADRTKFASAAASPGGCRRDPPSYRRYADAHGQR